MLNNLCVIKGPHPIRGWAPGVIIAQYYKEPDWPQSMYAPYQIQLDDGRLIFAPQDTNQVIYIVVFSIVIMFNPGNSCRGFCHLHCRANSRSGCRGGRI